MTRVVTSLGTLIGLLAMAPAAQAGSYSFSVGGHRFHVEAPRNCRATSCVSMSSHSLRRTDNVAPTRPVQATVLAPPPAPPAPVLAATTSQPVAPPPAPKTEALSPDPPRVELSRLDPPKTTRLDPPRMEPPAADPEIMPAKPSAKRSDDEPAYLPLGEWESTGANGTVRIERCGPALCGFALTEASTRGESVLVNMKPKSHDVWTGSIYSRSTGNTYYATMTLKTSGRLHVEACALGRFWCSGNDWTRVEEPRGQLITTSRQWGARS